MQTKQQIFTWDQKNVQLKSVQMSFNYLNENCLYFLAVIFFKRLNELYPIVWP